MQHIQQLQVGSKANITVHVMHISNATRSLDGTVTSHFDFPLLSFPFLFQNSKNVQKSKNGKNKFSIFSIKIDEISIFSVEKIDENDAFLGVLRFQRRKYHLGGGQV